MKKDNKKALYESIMTSVAKEVKKALNESSNDYSIIREFYNLADEYAKDKRDAHVTAYVVHSHNMMSTLETRTYENGKIIKKYKYWDGYLDSLTNDCFDGKITFGDKLPGGEYQSKIYFSAKSEDNYTLSRGKYKNYPEKIYFYIKLSEKGVKALEEIDKKKEERSYNKYNFEKDIETRKSEYISKKYGGLSPIVLDDIENLSDHLVCRTRLSKDKIKSKLIEFIKNI